VVNGGYLENWISWENEGEDFAGLEEVFGKGKKKSLWRGLERKYR